MAGKEKLIGYMDRKTPWQIADNIWENLVDWKNGSYIQATPQGEKAKIVEIKPK